jgi:peptidoglycan hydrolase CwlO-like protein
MTSRQPIRLCAVLAAVLGAFVLGAPAGASGAGTSKPVSPKVFKALAKTVSNVVKDVRTINNKIATINASIATINASITTMKGQIAQGQTSSRA